MLTMFNRRREDDLILAINKLATSVGGGLRAIALALSTPQDNSAQVQAEIDKITAELNLSTAQQQQAIDEIKGG